MRIPIVLIAGLLAAAPALASDPIIQLDLNGLAYQTLNPEGAATAFTGLSHTGSLQLLDVPAISALNQVLSNIGGSFVSQNFSGTLTGFTGGIDIDGGMVTGGSLIVEVNGGSADPDYYTALIVSNSGTVRTFVGGGFTIEGLTFQGAFDDATFGNVDVTPWFGVPLNGSFIQFNFQPNAGGGGYADMDVFAAVPAPGSCVLLVPAGLLAMRRRRVTPTVP